MNFRIIYFILIVCSSLIDAECTKAYKKHDDKNVARCFYTQEDIYRGFARNPCKYGCIERWKRCFYCGCKIEDHSKEKKEEPCRNFYSKCAREKAIEILY